MPTLQQTVSAVQDIAGVGHRDRCLIYVDSGAPEGIWVDASGAGPFTDRINRSDQIEASATMIAGLGFLVSPGETATIEGGAANNAIQAVSESGGNVPILFTEYRSPIDIENPNEAAGGGGGGGGGDMAKATYDADDDGVIDLANLDPLIPTYEVNPLAPIPAGRRPSVLACVARQNAATGNWDLIDDTGHYNVGLNTLTLPCSTTNLTVPFPSGRSVITFLVNPDESINKGVGAIFGASVISANATVQATANVTTAVLVHYDGVDWVVTHVESSAVRRLDYTTRFLGGNLYIDNTYCPATAYQISAIRPPADLNLIPLRPARHNGASTYTAFRFIDDSIPAYVSTADTRMAVHYQCGLGRRIIRLDGSLGSDRLLLDGGNAWIMAVMLPL